MMPVRSSQGQRHAMRHVRSILVASLILASAARPCSGAQYPPACDDSLTIWNVQCPSAPCHPTAATSTGDTLWVGLEGIVTAVDTKRSGVGFWMQMPAGGPYSGIRVFTANTIWPVVPGDRVLVRPSMVNEYGGETELVALSGAYGTNLQVVKIASGTPIPPLFVGTATDLAESSTTAEPLEGCLVQCDGPLRVARRDGPGAGFMVVDDRCAGCDSVRVDCGVLPNPSLEPPPLGVLLPFVRGVLAQTANGYRILISGTGWDPTPAAPTSWGTLKAFYR